MSTPPASFRWSTVAVPVLLPTLVFGVAEGAILPVIPTLAGDVGATLAVAGLIAAMITVGELLGALPSGWVLARISERTAMIAAAGISIVGALIALLLPGVVPLALGLGLIGIAGAVFSLARHAFVTVAVPLSHRARALSTLGGTLRIGMLIGPFLAAGLLALGFDAHSTLVVTIVAAAAVIVILLVAPDPEAPLRAARAAAPAAPRPGVMATIAERRRVLGTIGVGAAILSGMRAARQMVLPLWAAWAGIDPALAALVIGVGAAIDAALFYLGGMIMDRFGRRWTAVPAIIGLAAGNLVLAIGIGQAAPMPWFLAATVLFAVSNGISAGVLMTLGSDLADPVHPSAFLAVWRLEALLGGAAAPLAIAAVAAATTIGVAVGGTAAVGLVGAAILWRWTAPRRLAASAPR